MTIWVDADALPGAIKEILVRASVKRGVDIILVANQWLPKPKAARVDIVTVCAGADIADDYIVEHCQDADLVITSDIPLAARAVEKGAMVLTPYGKVLDEDNVREHLSIRDFSTELRDQGIETGGPSAFGQQQRQAFANALDRWLTKHADS